MPTTFNAIFIMSVFAAGVLSFFSPCIFPLLPVYFGNLMEDQGEKHLIIGRYQLALRPIWKTLGFIAGLGTVFLLLGYGAGALGSVLYHPYFNYILGILIIILGLHQMELFQFTLFNRQKQFNFNRKGQSGFVGAYLLGLSFSFGWTPCIGPVLSAVLALAASGGSGALYGGILMCLYTLGLALPFLVLALASTVLMRHFQAVKRHLLLIKRIGGALIVMMGIVLMFGQFNWLSTIIH